MFIKSWMVHLQWTKETKDLKLSGLGKEKRTIGDRDTTHQSWGQIWIYKKSKIFLFQLKTLLKRPTNTANFPQNFSLFDWLSNFKVADMFLWRGREKKLCRWLIFVVCPACPDCLGWLITGLYKLLMAGCWSDPLPGLPDPSPHSVSARSRVYAIRFLF